MEPVAGPLLADAWPQALQIGLRASMFLLLTAVVQHHFGDSATAAIGITTRFDTVVLFSALGFGNAATAYAARAVVAGNAAAARAAGVWAGVQAGLFASVIVLLMNVAGGALAALFVAAPDAELLTVMQQYFAIGAWSQVAGAVALAAMGAVQGGGSMRAPMVVDLLAFPIAIACVVTAVVADLGLTAVFASLVVGQAAVSALHLTYAARGRWPRSS